jgi:hypothetical protein
MILMDEFIAVSNPFDTKNKITNSFQSAGISRPVLLHSSRQKFKKFFKSHQESFN